MAAYTSLSLCSPSCSWSASSDRMKNCLKKVDICNWPSIMNIGSLWYSLSMLNYEYRFAWQGSGLHILCCSAWAWNVPSGAYIAIRSTYLCRDASDPFFGFTIPAVVKLHVLAQWVICSCFCHYYNYVKQPHYTHTHMLVMSSPQANTLITVDQI